MAQHASLLNPSSKTSLPSTIPTPHVQVIAISAKERCTLLPVAGGEPQPTAAASPPARAAALHLMPGLQPLHYQLEALLHRAGARQQRPAWAEFEDAWAEGLQE